jgi:heat shock protein HslJ
VEHSAGLRALTFQANGATTIYCREVTDTAYELAFLMALATTQ